jgi:hypothetical protein
VRFYLAPLAFAAACAGSASGTKPDAGADAKVFLDGPGGDAAISINLNETDTVVNAGVVACANTGTNITTDNNWYRAYQLSDYSQITGGLHVSAVQFGVSKAVNAGTITVGIGQYAGAIGGTTIDLSMVTTYVTATTAPPNTSGAPETINVPIDADIPKGGKFVVAIGAPSLVSSGGSFYLGGTSMSELHPGYWTSAACGYTTPVTTDSVGAGGGHVVITVSGTH